MTEVFRIATLRGKRNTSTELTCKTLKSEISCVELNLERDMKTHLVFFLWLSACVDIVHFLGLSGMSFHEYFNRTRARAKNWLEGAINRSLSQFSGYYIAFY